nr:adenine nucleotide transporter BT1, chloroplastic/mitochondrial-like [Quercus suber]
MGRKKGIQLFDDRRDGFFSVCDLGSPSPWNLQDGSTYFHPGGLFASVGQVGMGFGVSPNPSDSRDNGGVKVPHSDMYAKYMSSIEGFRIVKEEVVEVEKNKKKGGLKLKVKVSNPSLRRLISGAIAGAVSRTAVAPLETIRTHLMVGSSGHSTTEVFNDIIKTDGWQGLFRGNLVNVIRVAPSKAIEVLILIGYLSILELCFTMFDLDMDSHVGWLGCLCILQLCVLFVYAMSHEL